MSALADWLPLWGLAALGGVLAGLSTSFLIINLGLRLMPSGRAFLAEARDSGRLLAHPGRTTPKPVLWVFVVAIVASVAAGGFAFYDLLTRLEPVIWPTGRAIAVLYR